MDPKTDLYYMTPEREAVADRLAANATPIVIPRRKKPVYWEVGGCVRDFLSGKPSKDVDFAVEIDSFLELEEHLVAQGFKIHTTKPEFLTVRAGVPKDHPLYARTKDADFVMCRKDSDTSDGRRPDFVEPGTIFDDLARRDFTVNAIAYNPITEEYLDPHGGREDLKTNTLRFVGDPESRIYEDGLRVMRGFRFWVTKGLTPSYETYRALLSPLAKEMLQKVSIERIQMELEKMFKHDVHETLDILSHRMGPEMLDVIFRDGLWLKPSLEQ